MKQVQPGDKHIGARIRMRRMMQGLSQSDLGNALDVTFQQIQKYERGANRVSGGRLSQLSTVLNVPVAYFFEGMPGSQPVLSVSDDFATRFMAERQGIELARAFVAIGNPALKAAIVQIAQAAAAKQTKAAA